MGFMAGMTRSLRAAAGVLAAAAVVAACGGGSSHETFVPTRLIAFGDESSVITSDGHKYTINALDANGALDCASNPIWIQVLATAYGFGFDQCKPTGVTNSQAVSNAAADAKVANLAGQIDGFLLGSDFTSKDLVTVLIGTNDIVEQYQQYPDPVQSADAIKSELATRGATVAAQINRIANAGAKVLAITVPDVGLTPFAVTEEAANPGRAALLKEFSAAFNEALRLNLLNDGTKIGLVIEDELVQAYVSAGTAVFANVTQSACDLQVAQPPNCTTSTLLKDSGGTVIGSASTWLWADTLRLTPGGHSRLGSAALSRAQNNPF